MAIGYECIGTSASSITLRIDYETASYPYIRLFIRKTSETVATPYDFHKTSGTDFYKSFTGLDASTSYTVNMHVSTVDDHTDGYFVGASEIWTDEPSQGITIHIDNGTDFNDTYKAYIDTGNGWVPYSPRFDNGGGWDD